MPVTSEKDLPAIHKATWLKAMSAMELKNYGYAVQLLQGVLKSHPEFLLARQLTRKAAVAKNAGKKAGFGLSASGLGGGMKIQSLVKKDPIAALDAVEKALESDPYNPASNQLLKEAALAANLSDVALFALETIVEGNPKDTKTLHELAKLYISTGAPQKAVDVYSKILTIAPNDLTAVKGGKDAAAAASMQRGGWEKEETTYRDLIRNKDEAVALEQQSRVHRSDEMIDNLLVDLHAQMDADASNADTARRIAELYEQKNDLDTAVTWFNYAAELTGNTDTALVRKVSDLRLRQYDVSIAGYEEYLAANPGAPEAAEYQTQLEEIKKHRAFLVLDEARKRIERNPTDPQLRFELGEVLVATGNYKDAVPELQRAQSNPSVRLRAMSLLGQCYTARSMYDLAANILSRASSELFQMDNVKKDIVYNLGLVYEKMGQAEKSIDCMKQIYEVDYSYRDVAARVEGSYGGSEGSATA
jgi:tetratricopeptide (TPR) repeat protein